MQQLRGTTRFLAVEPAHSSIRTPTLCVRCTHSHRHPETCHVPTQAFAHPLCVPTAHSHRHPKTCRVPTRRPFQDRPGSYPVAIVNLFMMFLLVVDDVLRRFTMYPNLNFYRDNSLEISDDSAGIVYIATEVIPC